VNAENSGKLFDVGDPPESRWGAHSAPRPLALADEEGLLSHSQNPTFGLDFSALLVSFGCLPNTSFPLPVLIGLGKTLVGQTVRA